MFEVLGSMFTKPRTSNLKPSPVSPVPPIPLGYHHDSSIQHERDFEVHAIQADLVVVDHHMLLLHPS